MTIKITEKTVGLWSVDLGSAGNWLAHIGYDDHDKLDVSCRFRWYRDDKIGPDSRDERKFYSMEFDKTHLTRAEAERIAIEKIRAVFEGIREQSPTRQGWELMRGARTAREFMEILGTMPGMHIGKEEIDDPST